MSKNEFSNYALICGLLRDELEFRITLSLVVDARTEGLFDGIVLSTWFGEIEAIPGLREELCRLGITIVENFPPTVKVSGNTWAQHKAMLKGLRAIPDHAAVWRLRTDRSAHLLKSFRPVLEAGPSACRQMGNGPGVFERRVAAMAVVATAPFYAADFAFYGLKSDLLKMAHFDGVYDCLFRGCGAETRLWTHAFLKVFPRFGEFLEYVNVLGLSTHVVDAAREGRTIPDFVLYYYIFYWLQLYNNVELIENRSSSPLNLTALGALGGTPNGGVRVGTVASGFTVHLTLFNSQKALDDLVEGKFEDQSELGVRYMRILEDIKKNGVAALPSWTDAERECLQEWQKINPEVELLPNQGRVQFASEEALLQEAPADIFSGDHFRQMLERESQAGALDDETLALVGEKLALAKTGYDMGQVYYMIATEVFRMAGDDRARKTLGGFFLLRAAERGHVDAAGRYGWLVYSGRLEADTLDHAKRWSATAAFKENALAQYTCSLMCKNGWYGEERIEQADAWHEKAVKNGFTAAMLNFY